MPKPLSSQQNSTGIGRPWCTVYCARVQRAQGGRVVERGIAERAHGDRVRRPRGADTDSLRALDRERRPPSPGADGRRSSRSAGSPRARGCRTPCAARRRSAHPPRRPGRGGRPGPGSSPGPAAPARSRTRPSGNAGGPGRWAAAPPRSRRLTRGRQIRSCRRQGPPFADSARRGRDSCSPPSRRTQRGPSVRSAGCRRAPADRGPRAAAPPLSAPTRSRKLRSSACSGVSVAVTG